jgi:Domain of unknown function (DUF4440)
MVFARPTPRLLSHGLLALALLSTGCGQGSSEAARKDIQGAYAQMDLGLHTKNLQSVLSCVASDYTCVASNGHTYSRDQLESSLSDGFKTGDTESSTQIIDCKVSGETATVTTQTHQDTTFNDAVSGKPHKAAVVSRSEDTWRHEGTTWKLHASRELSHETLKDGKPYVPPAPPSATAKSKPSPSLDDPEPDAQASSKP